MIFKLKIDCFDSIHFSIKFLSIDRRRFSKHRDEILMARGWIFIVFGGWKRGLLGLHSANAFARLRCRFIELRSPEEGRSRRGLGHAPQLALSVSFFPLNAGWAWLRTLSGLSLVRFAYSEAGLQRCVYPSRHLLLGRLGANAHSLHNGFSLGYTSEGKRTRPCVREGVRKRKMMIGGNGLCRILTGLKWQK